MAEIVMVMPLYHWNQLSIALGDVKRRADKALAASMNGEEPHQDVINELRASFNAALVHLDNAEKMRSGA